MGMQIDFKYKTKSDDFTREDFHVIKHVKVCHQHGVCLDPRFFQYSSLMHTVCNHGFSCCLDVFVWVTRPCLILSVPTTYPQYVLQHFLPLASIVMHVALVVYDPFSLFSMCCTQCAR